MYFGTSQVSQEVERSAGKRTPRATSLRVLRVSVCIGPAHAEARRRGERERSAHKAGQTELHSSPEAGASRATRQARTKISRSMTVTLAGKGAAFACRLLFLWRATVHRTINVVFRAGGLCPILPRAYGL